MSILAHAIAQVPAGPWAVAVSGGADSVALFRLLLGRPDLWLHVVHLDHQTRGEASTADAEFVQQLAAERRVPYTVSLRGEVEPQFKDLPKNPSARYRAARMELFRQVVSRADLNGVILAHHADDQAETILHRLIRGSGPAGLAGMSPQTRIDGLLVIRPLLAVRRDDLRTYLSDIGQSWREDASNESDHYLRNRLRRWLTCEPGLHESMLTLGNSCHKLREWSRREAPVLEESFAAGMLSQLPAVLAHESARRWLVARGAPAGELSEAVLDRLIQMAQDAASAPRMQFPGSLLVRRRRGIISAEH
jgi:tRNA(Ile)-lysidine synthetase-like protein